MARRRARKPRKRNLSRQVKMAIGVGVLTAAGLTTYLVVRRRHHYVLPPPPTPTGPQGYMDPHLRVAKRNLCSRPQSLSAGDQELLISLVFAPLVAKYTGPLPSQPGPMQVDQALTMAATDAVHATCKQVVPGVVEMAQQLAHAAWLRQTGQSGL